MATTPSGPDDQAAPRWTGRASVSSPAPATTPAAPSPTGRAAVGSPARRPGSSVPPPPLPRAGAPVRGKRPRWGRIALVVVLALALVTGLGTVAAFLWARGVDSNLKRTDPFSQIAGGRPQSIADGSLNILLLGSDSRAPDAPVDTAGLARTDTIMILHVPASHDKAYVISVPRDLWVHVPKSADGQFGNTMAKINAAYAWGGEPLLVQTLEDYTGVRIDHVVLIDFFGFVKVTDALGGVDMNVDRTIKSIFPPWRTFTAGEHTFNGDEALDYVRQRYQLPDGDFGRERHQQEFLKDLLDKAASAGTLSNPAKFKDFVTAAAAAITVDKDFSLIDLGWQFRSLRSKDLTFMVSPNLGGATEGDESVVLSDKAKALALYDAVAKDNLAAYLASIAPAK